MKKTTVLFIEFGMLAGIISAGYFLPRNTSLRTFLLVSAACFLTGNLFLIRAAMMANAKGSATLDEAGPWPHILRAFGILAIGSIVTLLFLSLRR